MRVVLQRVTSSSVEINKQEIRSISRGLCILIGIEPFDEQDDINWLIRKVLNMRIFNDDSGVMNCSILDIQGEILIISQFTLFASTKKGNRPSYIKAAKPEISIPLYNAFVEKCRKDSNLIVQTGEFGADMLVNIANDGPVTIILDSKNKE